jgi:hypothetical protein
MIMVIMMYSYSVDILYNIAQCLLVIIFFKEMELDNDDDNDVERKGEGDTVEEELRR